MAGDVAPKPAARRATRCWSGAGGRERARARIRIWMMAEPTKSRHLLGSRAHRDARGQHPPSRLHPRFATRSWDRPSPPFAALRPSRATLPVESFDPTTTMMATSSAMAMAPISARRNNARVASRGVPLRRGASVVRRAGDGDFPEDSPERDWDAPRESVFLKPDGSPALASETDPTVWRLMQQTLREGEVEQILPAKAKLMAENDGWTLIDVRPYPDYCESHAWGAKNAQLYAPLEVNTLAKSLKQAATLALFPERLGDAYAAVEPNEYFLDEMQECVEWGDKVILYCGTGGVIGQADLNFADGRQTASLIAAHELAARGWGTENVKHMAGGLGMWEEIEGFDMGEVPAEDR